MDQIVKCVVVGDGGVGKTCMLVSYTTNTFPTDHLMTVFDNYTSTLLVDGYPVHLGLFDIGGQERYERIRTLAYHQTDVFLLCFSVADPDSFHNVQLKWIEEIRDYCPNVPIILVGTKHDLRSDPECVQKLTEERLCPIRFEQGVRLAKRLNMVEYIECSARTQYGLTNVFNQAAKIGRGHQENPQSIPERRRWWRRCTIL